ncbi:MAG: hypothetical protein WDW36_007849 [Sanguina aurantia]
MRRIHVALSAVQSRQVIVVQARYSGGVGGSSSRRDGPGGSSRGRGRGGGVGRPTYTPAPPAPPAQQSSEEQPRSERGALWPPAAPAAKPAGGAPAQEQSSRRDDRDSGSSYSSSSSRGGGSSSYSSRGRDSGSYGGRGRESGRSERSNVGRPMQESGDRSIDYRSPSSSERNNTGGSSGSSSTHSGSSQSTVGLGAVSNGSSGSSSRYGGGSSSAVASPPRPGPGVSRTGGRNYDEEEEEEAGVIVAGRNRGSSAPRPAPPPMSTHDDGDDDGDDDFGGGGEREEEEGFSRGGGRRASDQRGGGAWGRDVERAAARNENGELLGVANSIRDEIQGEVLYGVNPVQAAFRCDRRTAYALYVFENMDMGKRKDAGAVEEVIAAAKQRGAVVHYVGKHDLNLLSDSRPHQGLVLDCSPLSWEPLDQFQPSSTYEGGPMPVWLALDEVIDPQNLGALVRSAYCLGVTGVLACSKNCAPLSAVVSKSSAGALEAMQLHSCTNMPRTLADAVSKGWAVLGAAIHSNAVGIRNVKVDRPTILVVGSEGSGLRTNVKRACTTIVKIEMGVKAPMGARRTIVDSLNVSVATGILLHSILEGARKSSPPTEAGEDGEGGLSEEGGADGELSGDQEGGGEGSQGMWDAEGGGNTGRTLRRRVAGEETYFEE